MNRTKTWFLFAVLILSSLHGFADIPYNAWWQKANRFYEKKNYDSAAVYYAKLTALQPQNPEIFYNLGNTYYRLNKIGFAVLNYERALKLKPDYKQAQDNLELTQSRISNRIHQSHDIFFVTWWKGITKTSLANTWAIISLLLFFFTLIILLLRKWDKAPAWMHSQIAVISFLVCLCTLLFTYVASRKKVAHDRAVVMQQDVPLSSQPGTAKIKTLIPEGTVLKIEEEQAQWVHVKLPDGRSGWMPNASLSRI